jgi:hypothetical protein
MDGIFPRELALAMGRGRAIRCLAGFFFTPTKSAAADDAARCGFRRIDIRGFWVAGISVDGICVIETK